LVRQHAAQESQELAMVEAHIVNEKRRPRWRTGIPTNDCELNSLNWGTRGRGFKSRQPDWVEGVQMIVVSRILGHESIKTTVDIYGHLQDNQRKQAIVTLACLRGRVNGSTI